MVLNETRAHFALTKVRWTADGTITVRMPWSPGNREALEAVMDNVQLDQERQLWMGTVSTEKAFVKLCTMLRHRFTGDIHVAVEDEKPKQEVVAKFHTSWKRLSPTELVTN